MGRDMGLLMPSCEGLQSRMALTGMVCALGCVLWSRVQHCK